MVWPERDPKPKTRENVSTKASVYVNQLYFHFVEDPGDAVAKMDVCVCLCVCLSPANLTIPEVRLLLSCYFDLTWIVNVCFVCFKQVL